MSSQTIINLYRHFFTETEKPLVEYKGLTASIFLFSTGVHGLRLANNIGQIIVLPFQGQQIWRMGFYGRDLTMKSMFNQPNATTEYLRNYGGFAIHCGATAMGVPTGTDTHPLHGELPNAPYQTAQVILGDDEEGPFVGVTGTYQHTVAFNDNYVAQPLVKLHAGSSQVTQSMTIKNLKRSPMNLMYLAHVNFRPVDDSRLVYSAICDPRHVRVRSSIPSHISPPPGYREFLQDLEAHPEKHNILKAGLAFDPEVVFFIDYQTDQAGWAHTMQVHPDGSADFISHHPAELDHGVRWICRTADQDAIGIILPATAEPEGFSAEKAKGNLKTLAPGGEFHFELRFGALKAEEAVQMEVAIEQITGGRA